MRTELVSARGDTLRRWVADDAAGVASAFSDPSMSTQIDRPLTTVDAAVAWIDAHIARWEREEAFAWAIVRGPELLGSVSVASVDSVHETAWVSYWTCAAARGRGVASAALRCVSQWAFDDLGLFRLELGHRVNNPASCGVALSAGYAIEGVERQKLRYGDQRFDVELHARLASDPPLDDDSVQPAEGTVGGHG